MSHHLESLEGRQLFAAGAVDRSFGGLMVPFKPGVDGVLSHGQLAVDSAGNVYAAVDSRANTLQIRRLTPNGKLDTAWSAKHKGSLLFSLDAGQIGRTQMVVDKSDRLDVLLNGEVQRFTPDGNPDTTFADKGTLDLSNFAHVGGIAIDAANKLVVSGNVKSGPKAHRTTTLQVVRYRSFGKIDPIFQTKGVFQSANLVAGGSSSGGLPFALNDGSVLVSASSGVSSGGSTYLIKFRPDGSLDTAYGRHGVSAALAETSNDNGGRSVDIVGVRGDGTAIANITVASNTISDPQYDYLNGVISADGKTAGTQALGQDRDPNDSDGVIVGSVLTLPDNSVLLIANGELIHDDASFQYDSSYFNADTAALQPDGEILTLEFFSDNNVQVSRSFGMDPVVADFSAHKVRAATSVSTVRFQVTYKAPGGVDSDTLGGAGLRVVGADGRYRKPRLVDVVDDGLGDLTATYKTTAIDGSAWDSGDNGTYSVRLLDGFVKDKAGTAVSKRTLGTFVVAIHDAVSV